MKKRYMNELAVGSRVDEVFVLRSKELGRTRTGDAYLHMLVADRTGTMSAYRFGPSALELDIPAGALVRVTGTVGSYRGTKRITADAVVPAPKGDAADFVESSPRSETDLLAELHDLVVSVKDRTLARLLRGVFADTAAFERFKNVPATRSGHHAYVRGLLEHTVAVATACDQAAARYPQADRDLLVSSAILHDIGMIDALEVDTSIRYTDAGRLVGHSTLGVRRMREGARRAGLKDDDRRLLMVEHAILSHHGDRGPLGSTSGATLEAIVLAQIDALDATASAFITEVSAAARVDETWVEDSQVFGRPIRVPEGAVLEGGSDSGGVVRIA